MVPFSKNLLECQENVKKLEEESIRLNKVISDKIVETEQEAKIAYKIMQDEMEVEIEKAYDRVKKLEQTIVGLSIQLAAKQW